MRESAPNLPAVPRGPGLRRYEADAAFDASGLVSAPVSLLVEVSATGRAVALAVGRPDEVSRHPGAPAAREVSLRGWVLLPGLVNAHTHLDLTHLGPREHDPEDGFVAWVETVRAGRRQGDEEIAESVRLGVGLCLAGGTVAVGDISGAPSGRPTVAPLRALREGPLSGVSFVEFFAAGALRDRSLARLDQFLEEHAEELTAGSLVRAGLQPHAPNTVEPGGYEHAVALAQRYGLALCTHLAETVEERRFIADAEGPQRALLERVGAWEDRLLGVFGCGLHPIDHLAPTLSRAPFLVAHVNDCPDEERLRVLARAGVSVAYCPRASAYFGAPARFGAHRYREMLAAGINVCLGTDSIVNLPREAADESRGGMNVLDEMRVLVERDGVDARTALAMGTTNGARALGLDEAGFLLRARGRVAGLVAVRLSGGRATPTPTLETAILRGGPPRLLLIGK
ncbi:MAG: 8-oxoguanine deaminase [Phycisphaerales bacterium]|nr:amidohydrolase family protein [Phycisphaerales bacterium]GIK19386.1 MAG: metal-dependent hydrolase [Planctomycetota bacterium]